MTLQDFEFDRQDETDIHRFPVMGCRLPGRSRLDDSDSLCVKDRTDTSQDLDIPDSALFINSELCHDSSLEAVFRCLGGILDIIGNPFLEGFFIAILKNRLHFYVDIMEHIRILRIVDRFQIIRCRLSGAVFDFSDLLLYRLNFTVSLAGVPAGSCGRKAKDRSHRKKNDSLHLVIQQESQQPELPVHSS